MPFDSIMGVGRSPQVTKDYATNPYSIYGNMAGSMSVYRNDETYITKDGDPKNVTNEDFDSTSGYAYKFEIPTLLLGTTRNAFVVFDFGKEIWIKNISFKIKIVATTGGGVNGMNFAVNYSKGAITGLTNNQDILTTIYNSSGTSARNEVIIQENNYIRARAVIFSLSGQNISGGVGSMSMELYSLKITPDSMQF